MPQSMPYFAIAGVMGGMPSVRCEYQPDDQFVCRGVEGSWMRRDHTQVGFVPIVVGSTAVEVRCRSSTFGSRQMLRN